MFHDVLIMVAWYWFTCALALWVFSRIVP